MHRILIPIVIMGLLAGTPLAAQEEGTESPTAGAEGSLDDPETRASYALGVSFAQSLNDQGIEVDESVMMEGVRDALAGNSKLTSDEVQQTMVEFRKRTMAAQQAKAAEAAKAAIAIGDAYRAENAEKEGVVTLDSGLQYEVLTEGEGATPTLEDQVQVHYRGTLVDGTVFDSSYDRGSPATLSPQRVIKGWTEALQIMQTGSKWRLVIPPDLGYGERAGGTIPANSTLIFEVELLDVIAPETSEPPLAEE